MRFSTVPVALGLEPVSVCHGLLAGHAQEPVLEFHRLDRSTSRLHQGDAAAGGKELTDQSADE